MRFRTLSSITCCVLVLLLTLSSAAPAIVKLSLVIPEGHKVTDVNLRFERQKGKAEGSFEGASEDEDEEDERPSFGRSPDNAAGAGKETGRHRKVPNMVETFPVVAKKPGESHNTINKVIKLPEQNLASIRK